MFKNNARTLYHFPLSPFSRKVRLTLSEKGLEFDPVIEKYWERRREFIAMNPASQVPVLMEGGKSLLADSTAICEYLEESYPEPSLLGKNATDRAEVRRLANWFNSKFYYEVSKYMVDERVLKYFRNEGAPDCKVIRAAQSNILYHLDYIAYLCGHRKWLAGDYFSMADISAAAQISVLDYLNEVPWRHNEQAKEWYALVKSRPSFRALLQDKVINFTPPKHYTNLDF